MESRVGSVLRKARNRRRIELSDVEAATRIRVRFLRAIESEEWDELPGGVYTRGFIRTYASFLGLDGERLAEDYRRDVEGAASGDSAAELAAFAASSATGPAVGRRLPRLGWLAAAAVVLLAGVAMLGPWSADDEEGGSGSRSDRASGTGPSEDGSRQSKASASAKGVSLRLAALAEVWVCLLGAGGEPLVEGQILEAGMEEGPFRSGSFTVSFGNGEISMLIDGKQAEIPPTASPIGYSIDSAGRLTELGETERPTCV